MSQKVEKGGRVSPGMQKVHNSKCGLFGKSGGEAIFSFFPQIQKCPKHPGGGGGESKNCGLFPLFGTFFSSMAPLIGQKIIGLIKF